jgi:hypothetical protein
MTQPHTFTLTAALHDNTRCNETELLNHLVQPSVAMPSLLLVVFILQFLLHIVNTVGANTVNELVSPATVRYDVWIDSILTLVL